MGKNISVLLASILISSAAFAQEYVQTTVLSNEWQLKDQKMVLQALPEVFGDGSQGLAEKTSTAKSVLGKWNVPFKSDLTLVAERASPTFPGAPYESQATSTSVQGNDIVVSFATMGEETGGGLEWVKWTEQGPQVVGQFLQADVDFFSVVQVSDSILAVGQLKNSGAFMMEFKKNAAGNGFQGAPVAYYFDDYTGVEAQIITNNANGGMVQVITGSKGAAHWVSISKGKPFAILASNDSLNNPMGSYKMGCSGSYALEGTGPYQVTWLDANNKTRWVQGSLDLGTVAAPASLYIDGNKLLTNAGGAQLRTYQFRRKGGFDLLHYQQLDGLGNDLEIKGPFAALSQGDAGFMIGFISSLVRPFKVKQVIANPPMSANKSTMVRVGHHNYVFLSAGRKGLKVLEQKSYIDAADESTYSFHGPARFWLDRDISEFSNFREVSMRFTKQDGRNIICKWRQGKFCVCNWPVPVFVDFKSVDVDFVTTGSQSTVQVPIGYAI